MNLGSYQFKMEKVLEFKSSVEKTKVEDYARINIRLSKEQEHLEDLETQYRERQKHTVQDVNGMKMQFLYREQLKSQMNTQKNKVEEITVSLEQARSRVVEARKDRKIMENLKEKDKERFTQAVQMKEQKEMDDMTIMRFAK